MMNSKICEMLDIEFPLLAFTHCRDVVVAVSKAGGMGVLFGCQATPRQSPIVLNGLCPAELLPHCDEHVAKPLRLQSVVRL